MNTGGQKIQSNFRTLTAGLAAAAMASELDTPSPAKSGDGLSSRRLPKWWVEKSRRLHRNFLSIERRLARGEKLASLLREKAWHMGKCHYWCDRERSCAASWHALKTIYYRWKHEGRTPSCLLPRWRPGNQKLSTAILRLFISASVTTNAHSFRAAWLNMQPPIASPSAYSRALPLKTQKLLVKLFLLRRKVASVAKKLDKALQ